MDLSSKIILQNLPLPFKSRQLRCIVRIRSSLEPRFLNLISSALSSAHFIPLVSHAIVLSRRLSFRGNGGR